MIKNERKAKGLYSIIFLFALITYADFIPLLTPPAKPEGLVSERGRIQQIAQGGRSHMGGKLIVLNEKGEEFTAYRKFSDDEVNAIKMIIGKNANLLYQFEISPFLFKYPSLRGLSCDSKILIHYNYDWRVKMYRYNIYSFVAWSTALGALIAYAFYLKVRNKTIS